MQDVRLQLSNRQQILDRLTTISATLNHELSYLPSAATLDARAMSEFANSATPDSAAHALRQAVSDYWAAPAANGMPRGQLFSLALEHSLHDELTLKTADGTVHADYLRCLPGAPDTQDLRFNALSVKFNEHTVAEIAGALVITASQGHTLLSTPGLGLEAFASEQAMIEALTTRFNNPTLRAPLLRNAERQLEQTLLSVDQDSDLFLEPFQASDWQLKPLDEQPFAYAVSRQVYKQQADIEYELATRKDHETLAAWRSRINQAIRMPRLFGPEAMLDMYAAEQSQRTLAQGLPDWLKIASPEDRQRCIEGFQQYELSRSALSSALSGALAPEQYASIRLQARIENDLGYALDPDHLIITTRRGLPQTGEPYQTSRSLTRLALYGLHPGDRLADSAFLAHSRCEIEGAAVTQDYPGLTLDYLAALIDELDLRAGFRPFQLQAYGTIQIQQLMCSAMRLQLKSQAFAAQLQGHIRRTDFDLIDSLDQDLVTASSTLLIQRLTLAGKDTLSSTLVFRQQDAQGNVERLILFTPDRPGERVFQAFDNDRQMLHEIVGWSASNVLSAFLLDQVGPSRRGALQDLLSALRAKPQPAADFLTFVSQQDYDEGLRALVLATARITLAEHSVQTPDWYLHASALQRQTLVALEDAIAGAEKAYQDKPHTHVAEFEAYVHQRAHEKINALLDKPEVAVDPDRIIITSPREKLSYTQLLRNGYDDSIGFINETLEGSASFEGPTGIDLAPLTAEKVARSVRGKWLSDDYVSQIKNTLLNVQYEGYEYRRNNSLLITQLQMSAAALRSRLKGEISAEQHAWLSRSIEWMNLNDQMTRERSPIYPLQFKVRYSLLASGVQALDDAVDILKDVVTLGAGPDITELETVQGCLILMPDNSRRHEQALLYTPQAPDGLVFRPLSSFLDTLKREGMSDYYKDRCRLKANRALAFFLHDMKQGGNSPQPTLPAIAHMDLRDVCFNRKLLRKIRDIEETTRGRSDMISKLMWDSAETLAVAITLPFPIASFAVGAALMLRDSARAFHALSEGDRDAASGYVLSSMLNALGAVGDLHSGIKGFGSVLRDIRAPANTHAIAQAAAQLQRAPAISELRPLSIQGELVWAAKPNSAGLAELFQSVDGHLNDVLPTGQFAESNALGQWLPLQPIGASALPPTPKAAHAAYAVDLSLADTAGITRGHAKGTTLLRGKHYIPLDDAVYQVQFDSRMGFWQIVDPGNPFAFFGKQPVALDTQGQWQALDPLKLRGGMPNRFKPLKEQAAGSSTAVSDISDYELPAQFKHFLFGILHDDVTTTLTHYNLGLEKMFEDVFKDGRQTYATLRQNLRRDALEFFANTPATVKPPLPVIAEAAAPENVISAVFEHSNGLVISEAPTSVASKQWLIENMQRLAEQKTEILYVQHLLTDQHVHKLQKYKALGKKSRSGSHELKEHFDSVNNGALNNGSNTFDYYHLIKAAHRYGIEVKPLNSSVSYAFRSYEQISAPVEALSGQKMTSFFGNKVISTDVAQEPGRRWVALLDHASANRHDDMPGISELQGAISLRIEPAVPGMPGKITRDTAQGEHPASLIHSDFKLELASTLIDDAAGSAPSIIHLKPGPLDDALYNLFEGHSLTEWGIDRRAATLAMTDKNPGNPYVGEQGFEWHAEGRWRRAEAATWVANTPLTPIQRSLIDPHYQVADEMRVRVHDLANFQHRGLHDRYYFADPDIAPARDAFFELRKQLEQDAQAVLAVELPARPPFPDIAADTPLPAFLDSLYERAWGVVIGESHSSVASKKLLIDNLEHLAAQDVKTLYMEHLLTDLHQADLDRFADTGQMSKTLLHDLKILDKHFHTDPAKVFTFENLVIKAREFGVEVRAIDCAASYFVKSLPSATDTTRQQMMNFFASRTITRHQAVTGQHKWIALVGNTHANTYQEVVPGVAELQQAIGVRVMDVDATQARGALRDPGQFVNPGLGQAEVFLKSDYRVEMPKQPQAVVPMSLESRLYQPGMFLIDESQPARPVILHRSRDKTLQQTAVRYSNDGTLCIERPAWPDLHRKPFADLAQLTAALEAMSLKNMG